MTDLTPVHVIPEALSYPLQANLDVNEIIYDYIAVDIQS